VWLKSSAEEEARSSAGFTTMSRHPHSYSTMASAPAELLWGRWCVVTRIGKSCYERLGYLDVSDVSRTRSRGCSETLRHGETAMREV